MRLLMMLLVFNCQACQSAPKPLLHKKHRHVQRVATKNDAAMQAMLKSLRE